MILILGFSKKIQTVGKFLKKGIAQEELELKTRRWVLRGGVCHTIHIIIFNAYLKKESGSPNRSAGFLHP
jgi:hypothetical protein